MGRKLVIWAQVFWVCVLTGTPLTASGADAELSTPQVLPQVFLEGRHAIDGLAADFSRFHHGMKLPTLRANSQDSLTRQADAVKAFHRDAPRIDILVAVVSRAHAMGLEFLFDRKGIVLFGR